MVRRGVWQPLHGCPARLADSDFLPIDSTARGGDHRSQLYMYHTQKVFDLSDSPFPSAWSAQASIPPEKLAQIQTSFSDALMRLANQAREGALDAPRDRRFQAKAWSASLGHAYMAHAYLIASDAIEQMVDAATLDEPMRERLRFAAM